METVRFSRIGKEDLVLGSGTFQVTLANGQVVSIQKLDIGYFYDNVSTVADLPSSAPTGTLRRVTDGTGLLYIYDGSSWVPMANFWAGTTEGDIIQADSSGDPERLGIGTALQMLLVNSGATALAYVASPQSVLTTTGDILYASAANTLARLAIGSNNQVLTISSGIPAWGSISLPRSYLAGLQTSIGTDTDHDIDIAVGVARDADNSTDLQLTSALTKQIDADWAVGDGNGGFPSGLTLSTDTWYHVFLVDDSNGDTDAGFDSSLTASNLLSDSGGSKYRRIGSVLTNGSSNIISYVQDGDLFQWSSPPEDVNDTNPGTSAVLRTLSTPEGVNVVANLLVSMNTSTTNVSFNLYISDPNTDDLVASLQRGHVGPVQNTTGTNLRSVSWAEARTNQASKIRSRMDNSDANTNVFIVTVGWYDKRGKDD